MLVPARGARPTWSIWKASPIPLVLHTGRQGAQPSKSRPRDGLLPSSLPPRSPTGGVGWRGVPTHGFSRDFPATSSPPAGWAPWLLRSGGSFTSTNPQLRQVGIPWGAVPAQAGVRGVAGTQLLRSTSPGPWLLDSLRWKKRSILLHKTLEKTWAFLHWGNEAWLRASMEARICCTQWIYPNAANQLTLIRIWFHIIVITCYLTQGKGTPLFF